MSEHPESPTPGAIPHFPFQEPPAELSGGRHSGPAEGAPASADLNALREALDTAVQVALRSFHEYVGGLGRQRMAVAVEMQPSGGMVGAGGSGFPAFRDLSGPMGLPPRAFPSAEMEAGCSPRAVLTPAQQAQLDQALALAFAVDEAPRPAGPLPNCLSESVPPPRSPALEAELPMAIAPPPVFSFPEAPVLSPFSVISPQAEAPSPSLPPGLMPAPPALVAAAPPLPQLPSPFHAGQAPPSLASAAQLPSIPPPTAPVMAAVPLAASAPTPVVLPDPAPPASTLPFSPFQGLEPAPRAPLAEQEGAAPERAPAAWPQSPFFGATQAATAPFRVVEPPPLLVSAPGEILSEPAASDRSAPPPIPDQGPVFNFAELLRANGQR